MEIVRNVVTSFFTMGLFFNAILFIPQIIRILKEKTAHGISLITFAGLLLIQLSIVLHGFFSQDYLLTIGYVISMVTCGTVVLLAIFYRKKGYSYTDKLELLENIIAVMPGNVYWMDRNGVYLGCNDNEARAVGLSSRKEIIGKRNIDIPDFVIPDVLDKINQQVIDTNQTIVIEEPAVLKDGTEATFLSSKVPLHDADENVVGVVGISIDITERKKAEEAIKLAKEKAVAANAAKSQFIENMQHDLRTPVIGTAGMLDIWAKEEKNPEKKELFRLMAAHAKDLRKIFDDILHFTHIEADDLPILEQKFHVHKLIEEVINIEKPAAIMQELEIISKIDKNVPKVVKGDYFRLQGILINLFSNAVKFTKKGSVTINVKRKIDKNVKKNQVFLKFIVSDTGIGIPKNQQSRIYEKFVKLDPSNRCGNYRGSGLGLTIVKKFVEDLGGEVDLISYLGEGSKFTIVVPLSLSILNEPDREDFEETIFFK